MTSFYLSASRKRGARHARPSSIRGAANATIENDTAPALVRFLAPLVLFSLLAAPAAASAPVPSARAPQNQKAAKKGARDPGEEAARHKRRAAEREREVTAHFEICDLDSNGWVSFREAAVTLGIEKAEFRLYDENKDGRIDSDEFRERYQTILGLLGAVRPPVRPEPEEEESEEAAEEVPVEDESHVRLPETFPSPRDLLDIYDRDQSAGLAQEEVRALFTDIGGVLSADVVSRQMDPDKSGEIELSELGPLALLVSKRLPEAGSRATNERQEQELVEIFRITLPRKLPPGAPPEPPQILGPVTHFRRLDLWNDGFVDAEDLRQLLAPARINVRPSAVIAALDQNGDSRLDPGEFEDCLKRR